MRAIRLSIAPDLSMGDFVHALGFRDVRTWRRYEADDKPIPPTLAGWMHTLDELGYVPADIDLAVERARKRPAAIKRLKTIKERNAEKTPPRQ